MTRPIARATVEVVADASSFRRSLRRELREAGTGSGFGRSLDREMDRAGRSAGRRFSRSFSDTAGRDRDSLTRLGDSIVSSFRSIGRDIDRALRPALTRVAGRMRTFGRSAAIEFAGGFDLVRLRMRSIADRLPDPIRRAGAAFARAGTFVSRLFVDAFRRMGRIGADVVERLTSGARTRARTEGMLAGRAFSSGFDAAASGAGGGGRGLMVFGTSLHVIAAAAIGAGAALQQLLPLLFGIPALASVAAGAIATLVVAFEGFATTLSNLGNVDEFEQSLANLSPSAASVAREIKAFSDAFGELRGLIQEALFSQLIGVFDQLTATLVGPLAEGMTVAATAFGQFFALIGEFFAQDLTAQAFTSVFDTVAASIAAIGPGIIDFLEGFRILTVALLPSIEALATSFSAVLTQFGAFLTDAAIGGEAAQQFGQAVEFLSGIIEFLFSVFQSLSPALSALSPALSSFFGAIADGLSAAGPGLEAFAIAAGNLIVALSPFITMIGEELNVILQALAPFLQAAAEGFASLAETAAPFFEVLLPQLETLAGLAGEVLATAITTVLSVIEQLLPTIATLIAVFVDEMLPIWEQFSGQINELLPSIGDLVVALAGALIPVFDALLPVIAQIGQALTGALLEVLLDIIPVIADLIVNITPAIEIFAQLASLLIGPVVFALRAVGVIVGALSDAVRLLIGWINDAIDAFESLVGFEGTDLSFGQIPGSNAKGNIFTSPRITRVGEAGTEVLIPLAYPDRAVSLARESGLLDLLASKGATTTTTTSGPQIGDVTVNVNSPAADPRAVARRVGAEFARAMGV